MKHLILYSALLLIAGCMQKEGPVSPHGQHASFEIYFLKDTSITEYQANQISLERLDPKETPWLSDEDVSFYDFSSHCIYLKGQKADFFEHFGKFYLLDPWSRSKPFVVLANHERCYVGALHSAILATAPAGPYMDELDIGFYPVDVMHISRAWTGNVDVRKNALIQQALVMLGLFHSGISASLDSVKIISNFDTATVQCSFTITNNDKERLMIIDPDKMGTPLFHYYTNGVVFRGNGTLFQSEYKKVTSPGVAYDTSWYSGLSPQESMKRTVTVKGYPKIPPGTYSCSFTFANPVEVAKENRQTAGGRIWLGDVEARSIEVVIR